VLWKSGRDELSVRILIIIPIGVAENVVQAVLAFTLVGRFTIHFLKVLVIGFADIVLLDD
jgi:hypothetical protein